ncbi:proline iminopeptidase-family hydrolase [Marinactinospora thermotolerans]|uniref:Proline iminopeptidase n=1 Tax=Marinactinospora thermotolerans DSM 45154 TaxID=1122192 RepID=A0A1T4TI69_9ACTN|nr:proline iminopeptidase-family hydrolase [Marinactinospora thermotolerans]SKA40008.1 L-proline amide hydrolase [Marinactinospora thermotolerans DSM 45154]
MARSPDARGTVPFGEYATWYRVTGKPGNGRPTVVVLHGGPGATHDYLLGMTALADQGWPVVHYDQLGNGGSTHIDGADPGFWTPRLFNDELGNLVERLGVAGDYVLYGHSWGGLLAALHAAGRPPGLRGLIIANSPASYPEWRRELKLLRDRLPPGVDATLREHEAAGTTDTRAYFEAMKVFYDRHVLRVDPWPRDFTATFMDTSSNPTVYHTMNGPCEFHVIGTLKDWSVVDLLPRIAAPTLVISGRHDEVTPESVRPFLDLVPDVRGHEFADSSHSPHLEEPERFIEVVAEFLTSLE